MFWIRASTFILGLLASSLSAGADERIGAFQIYDAIQDVILLDGEIGINTPLEFRRAILARPDTKVVVLNSPGGLVASALIMADDLHRQGLSTVIPEGFGCYSSCSYVFLAGIERLVEGELGVHQMYGTDDTSGVQSSVSDVIEALESFDTPTEVITRMFRTPSKDIYVFSKEEIDDIGINRLGPTVLTTTNIASIMPPSTSPTTAQHNDKVGPPSEPTGGLGEAEDPPQSFGPRVVLYGGLDFYGNDISSDRMPTVVECSVACLDNQQCKAFTFNANPALSRGPNCFLKSDVDRLEAYGDALSGLFLPAGNRDAETFSVGGIDPTADILAKMGLTGPDFASSPESGISTLGDCRMACVDERSCRAFTYDSRLKQCYLKTGPGTKFVSQKLTSGIKRDSEFPPLRVIDLTD